jgi:lipopolysaccharide transport system ATP-binding protein
MTETAIRVEHLSKKYRIGGPQTSYKTLRETLMSAVSAPTRWIKRSGNGPSTFWALDDVSFEISQGEAIGIIGRNGAGKSTLLKILARITRPTCGKAELFGRVSALLEVGTGFHGELTGRENIFLNGAILGMRGQEIMRKFDQIVDFSGVEKFLDTPVKYYSSGMYVRLAFAVAAHLEPEILVVDEVLAVGDAEFQKKCLNKMGTATSEGRTVLFVSHNMSAIQDLCANAFWLDHGRVVYSGDAKSTVAAYLSKHARELKEQHWTDLISAPGNETVRVVYAGIQAETGHDPHYWTVETPLTLTFRIFNHRPDLPLYLNFHVYNQQGVCVFNTVSERGLQPRGIVEGVCRIPGNLLNDDTYSVKFMAHFRGTFGVIVDDALVFEINDIGREGIDYYGKWSGVTRPKLEWKIRSLGTDKFDMNPGDA